LSELLGIFLVLDFGGRSATKVVAAKGGAVGARDANFGAEEVGGEGFECEGIGEDAFALEEEQIGFILLRITLTLGIVLVK